MSIVKHVVDEYDSIEHVQTDNIGWTVKSFIALKSKQKVKNARNEQVIKQ